MKRAVVATFALLAGTLSAPAFAKAWSIVEEGKPFASISGDFTLQLPAGWKVTKTDRFPGQMATRDGELLQRIDVEFRSHAKAFRKSKLQSNAGLMPHEQAERLLAEIQAEGHLEDVEVIRNEPELVDGHPGFRLQVAYKVPIDGDPLRYRAILVGVATDAGLVLVSYRAPALHFFARDLVTFERSLQTFHLRARERSRPR